MTTPPGFWDYNFHFPLTGLALALTGMAALQQAGVLASGTLPTNMLGDLRDSTGAINPAAPTWVGRPGSAASSYTDPNGNAVTVPAAGDPAQYYIAIRAAIDPATLPVDPSSFGLVASDAADSAAVLGVWS